VTNYQLWILGFSIFQFVYSNVIAFYVWWQNRDKVTSSRLKAIEDRITKVETKVKSMPVCGNHGRMEENDVKLFQRFDELHGDIRELTGGVKGLTGAVAMINEHLINGRK
jgi:hypothetical protein